MYDTDRSLSLCRAEHLLREVSIEKWILIDYSAQLRDFLTIFMAIATEKKVPPAAVVSVRKHHHFHPFFAVTLILVGFSLAVLLQYGHNALNSFRQRVEPERLESGMQFTDSLKQLTLGVGPVLGDTDASITVVEFSDYQCPLCKEYFMQSYPFIQKNYIDTGKAMYEIRNYPLPDIHPHALIAAEATLCAEKQNAFESMHDKLFTSQEEWSTVADPVAVFLTYAAAFQLDIPSFQACLDTHETQNNVAQDVLDAKAAGINGTPTFWIFKDGVQVLQVNGAYPYAFFEQIFKELLQSEEISSSSSSSSSSISSI
jgi:protein-disulfide isomerase